MRLCVSTFQRARSVHVETSVRTLIQEYSSSISTRLTRRSSARTSLTTWKSVSTGTSAPSRTARMRSVLSLSTTMSLIKISTCSTTKQSSVPSTWQSTTKPYAYTLTICKITVEILLTTHTNPFPVSTGSWRTTYTTMILAARMDWTATCVMAGSNYSITPTLIKPVSVCRLNAVRVSALTFTPKKRKE